MIVNPIPRDRPGCEHTGDVLALRFDCGAGGHQVRFVCVSCWRKGRALTHAAVAALPVVDADAEVIERAAECFRRAHA